MKMNFTTGITLTLALATLLIITYSLISIADASILGKPFGLTINLGNIYIFKELTNNNYLLGINKGGRNYIVLAKINASIPPSIVPLVNISIPSKPCCVTVDNKSSPTSIAIVYNNVLLIHDLTSNGQLQFALPGRPLKVYPVGEKSFIVLTNKALIAIRYDKNGWFEERTIVGNLLNNRREDRYIFDVIPVYQDGLNYSYINVAEEAATYSVKARVLLLWSNGTLIKNGQLIGLIKEESITTPFAQVLNGTATLLLLPGSYNLSLFLKQGAICIKGPTIKVRAEANTVLRLGPIIFSNTSITSCPEPIEARYLVLIGPGFPPREVVLPESSFQELGNIRLLSAYITNNYLYIWITGSNSKLFTSDNFVAVLVYDKNNLKPLTSLWRYYDGISADKLIPSRDYRLVVFSYQNKIYLAFMENNTYNLAWSLPLKDTVKSIAIARYANGYLVLSISKSGYLQMVFVRKSSPPTILTLSNYNTPWISFNGARTGYIATKPIIYMTISSPKGITILTNLNELIHRLIPIQDIYDYIVGYTKIMVYNPDGKIIRNYIVRENLTYHNITLLSTTVTASNGEAELPCISYGTVKALIIPQNKELYKERYISMKCSNTKIRYNDINITLPYVLHKIILSIIDKYSNTPPLHDLEIILVNVKRNNTKKILYPAKSEHITIDNLIPGIYLMKIIDPRGDLYKTKLVNISVTKDEFIKIFIDRKPVIITIKLIPKISNAAKNIQITDKLNVTVYAAKKILFKYLVMAPSRAPIDISFTTLYRGSAVVEIKDIPPPGYGKFFKNVKKSIYIRTEAKSILYTIILQQLKHTVTIHVTTPENKPIRYTLEIYPANSAKPLRVVNSTTPTHEILLPIGYYCFHVIPLAKYLGFKLYRPATRCSKVTGEINQVISIKVKRLRRPTNVSIMDPLSRKGTILDNLTIILDGKIVASIPKGKPKTLTLPLLLNGSIIDVSSEHSVYKPLKRSIKPRSKPIVLKIIRTPFKYKLVVLSTQGKALSGAIVNINGIDNILHLKYVTNQKGAISITLPYGTYHICVLRTGYLPKCYTLSIHASANDVVILKPTLATIIRGFMMPITVIVIGALLIIITKTYFKRILERLSEEEF